MRKEYDGVPLHTNKQGYHVPDFTYRHPENRKVRIVTIGAGMSGILIAYKFAKSMENFELVLYEKNGDVGGTWLENRYPNCACDVPSHSYTYNFALNPYWPELYSKSPEIWKYLDRVCRAFDLRKYMQFNSRVTDAVWSEDEGKWLLKVEVTYADGSTELFDDRCDVLLQASGLLNNPVKPNIEGLDQFKGRIVHTAQWPDDFGPEQWKDSTVAVIGAGSSSVQTTPGLQPYVKKLHVFARSKTWLASAQPDQMRSPNFSDEEQYEFSHDHEKLVNQARAYEVGVNRVWGAMFQDAPQQAMLRERCTAKMEKHLKSERLINGLLPKFAVGCRRTSPGVSFMEAITQPNVDVHLTSVTKITADGLVGEDGTEVSGIDTLVLATGFDTTYRPKFKVVGRNGVSIQEKLTPDPNTYLGVAVPDIPNYLLFFGPTFPVLAGSVTASLGAVADLAVEMAKKIQGENLRGLSPRQDVTDQFAEHTQTMLHGTVWEDDCNSWYTRRDGRITAVWPGGALHFQEVVKNPRWEDWSITYMNKQNMWEFLGRGFTRVERTEGADIAPYMKVGSLEPAFYDFEKTPLRKEPAPTAAQARTASMQQRPQAQPSAETNGVAKEAGFANGELGQVDGFTGTLNYRDEISEEKEEKADGSGIVV